MRTTLTIDDDVLSAAREIAEHRRASVGAVLSDLARKQILGGKEQTGHLARSRSGLPLLPAREGSGIVTTELVNRLQEENAQ